MLTAVYALVAVMALPGSLSASDEPVPPPSETAQVAPEAPDSPDASDAELPTASDGQQAGVGEPTDPAPPAVAEPAPTEPAPEAAPPPVPAQAPSGEPAAEPSEDPAAEPALAERRAERKPAEKRERLQRPVARAAATQSVTIRDFAFSPRTVTVQAGDTVTWGNEDSVQHSATAEDGTFDTGLLGEGESGQHSFQEAGTYEYVCTPHPNMHGTVIVEAASTGGDAGSDADQGAAGDSAPSDDSASSDDSSSTSGSSSSSSTGTSSGSTSTLPDTGADVAMLVLLGLLFLACGAAVQSHAGRAG